MHEANESLEGKALQRFSLHVIMQGYLILTNIALMLSIPHSDAVLYATAALQACSCFNKLHHESSLQQTLRNSHSGRRTGTHTRED